MTINEILDLPGDDLAALVADEAKLAQILAAHLPYTRPAAPAGNTAMLAGKMTSVMSGGLLARVEALKKQQAEKNTIKLGANKPK